MEHDLMEMLIALGEKLLGFDLANEKMAVDPAHRWVARGWIEDGTQDGKAIEVKGATPVDACTAALASAQIAQK